MLNKRICLFVYKRLTKQWITTLYTSDERNIDICFNIVVVRLTIQYLNQQLIDTKKKR